MSHLRAPAARADRREGARHGRPAARTAPALPETHIRPQLLRLAVLPPVAVALSGCAAVLFTVRSTGARPGPTLWAVLGGAVFVTLVGIAVAAVAAGRAARSVHDRIGVLRRATARREADLRTLVETLRRGDGPPQHSPHSRHGGTDEDTDDFDLLAGDLARAHDGAVTAVVQASQLSSQAGSEQKLEVFVNLARRLQSLVHREISILDELENEMEDPDLLKGLFHVDHLATRIRRHAENLAVLGGAVSRRQWSNPVSMTEVLRSAIAEVEQYSRVKLVPPIDGTLRGHAVADVIHLLAELVENATVFSAPHTQVLLRANLVTSGLAVEVEDRGLGMPLEEQTRMNALLADPDQVNVARLLADGRIGLFVVSQLARRHGITVRLQSNIYGGVQAVLVVPQALLGAEAGTSPAGGAGAFGGQVPAEGAVPGFPAAPSQASGFAPQPGSGSGSRSGSESGVDSGSGAGSGGVTGARSSSLPGSDLPPPAPSGVHAAPRGRHHAPEPAPDAGRDAGRPAPLPVRGAHRERPTPAEARPGISDDDRRILAENVTAVPTPRNGAVRGTMGKPQLPRRRAQEHIVPQLRDGPVPRQDSDVLVGHDPGLMAAFQRGISLAEAQQHMEAATTEWAGRETAAPTDAAPVDAASVEAGPMEAAPMEAASMDPRHGERAHPEPMNRTSALTDYSRTASSAPMDSTAPVDSAPMNSAHTASAPTASAPTASAHRDLSRPDRTTTRHDGSAPAG
ncbi:sensor histidine kinase [Streptomyces dubilierae]|uniref:histidine kinase n=1 Tax=Streptomyces dubilierae TaxID=3075533 RepID=A0ABU2PHC9_9ACTN|nr:ATP-binding protein [Streptomyces sp. DSM 41921]MDT0391568.1 ATP-binding protein [Streptomyces sp. DSM 41921]